MIAPFFLEFGLIIIIATILGLVFRKLNQPIMLAYIVTGIALGASFLNVITYYDTINLFSEIGIAFLLYLVGLNLSTNILKEVGRASIIVGFGQIIVTAVIGFFLSMALGFSIVEASYLGIALAFSSTIIVVKLLSDKNMLSSLYGKVSVGLLLVQDFVAIIALIFIASIGTQFDLSTTVSSFLLRGIGLLVLSAIVAKFVLPKLFDEFAESQELLFLSGISWAFFLSGVSLYLGFSIEIGALVAGVTLASLPYSFEIAGKIRYLRDFFLVMFFVALGSQVVFQSANIILLPAIILSVFVLIAKTIIVIPLMASLGYKSRTSFLTGLTMAQISEFSLLLVALGAKFGHISQNVVALTTLVGVITISASTYMIQHGEQIYEFAIKRIAFLQRKKFFQEISEMIQEKHYDVVFLGFGKLGHSIFNSTSIEKEKILVIDINPELAKELRRAGFECIFSDGIAPDTMELIKRGNPKTIISTIREDEISARLLEETSKWDKKPWIVLTTENLKTAIKLYEKGASYIIIPQMLVGNQIKETIKKIHSRQEMQKEKNSWMRELKEMQEQKIN